MVKSAEQYKEAAEDEIKILKHVNLLRKLYLFLMIHEKCFLLRLALLIQMILTAIEW